MDTSTINPSNTFIKSAAAFVNKRIFLLAVLLFVTAAAYLPVLKAQFIHGKDDVFLSKNTALISSDMRQFNQVLKARIEGVRSPLSNVLIFIENKLFGLNPFVFHITSLVLHLALVICLFFLALSLGLKQKEAFLGALIFALHPAKVEAVAWIGARQELLAAFFYVLTLIAYQKNRYWMGLAAFILALLAHPMSASLPLVMLIIDWVNGKKIDAALVLAKWFYLLAAVVIWWKNYLQFIDVSKGGVLDVLGLWCWALSFYVQKFIFPVVLAPIYSYPQGPVLFHWPHLMTVFMAGLMLAGLWKWGQHKRFVGAVLFYIALVAFALRFDLAGGIGFIADRHVYLASASLCFLSAVVFFRANDFLKTQEPFLRYLFQLAVFLLMAGFFLLTFNQASIWQSAERLWRHQLKVLPHPAAYNYLADILKNSGVADKEREELYRKAMVQDPRYLESYINLGDFYKDRARYEEALTAYRSALSFNAKHVKAGLGMAAVFQKQDKAQAASDVLKNLLKDNPDDEDVYTAVIESYSQAVSAHPQEKLYQLQREEALSEYEELSKRKKYSSGDYFNLGFLYEQVGGDEEAVRFYRKALEINPRHEKALYHLAGRYREAGDFKSALMLYQQLIQVNPKNVSAYLNMGIIYNALGEVSRAKMFYHKTISLDAKNAGAYFNLGYLYESAGDLKEALNYYEKAIENDAKMAEVYYNMGNVYAALGQTAEAIASYLRTVSVDARHQNAFVNLSILSFKSRDFTGALRYLEEARKLGYTAPAEYLKALEPYKKK